MKRFTFVFLVLTGISALSFAQTAGADSFRQEGIASWYGKEFDGKPTASGEIFNSGWFTAAHPTLPFNTYLIVTNKQNGRRVTVRVNDRGPFVAARIVDLSAAAAEALDMVATGTAPVILEQTATAVLGPMPMGRTVTASSAPAAETAPDGSSAPATGIPQAETSAVETGTAVSPVAALGTVNTAPNFIPAPPAKIQGRLPPLGSASLYRLQVGSYRLTKNAQDAFNKLKNAGLNPAYEKFGEYNRVVLAKLNAAEIPAIAQILGNAGFPEAIIKEER